MKTNQTTTNALTLYADYFTDVRAVLGTFLAKQPTDAIRTLAQTLHQDHKTITRTTYAPETLTALQALHDEHQTQAQTARAQAHRLTLDEDTRAEYAEQAQHHANAMQDTTADIADINNALAVTLSESLDLVHIAYLADLETPTERETQSAEEISYPAEIARAGNHKTPSAYPALNAGLSAVVYLEQATPDQRADTVHALAHRRHRRNAIARAIRAHRGADTLDGYHTRIIPATLDDVKQWTNAGHLTAPDYSKPTKGGTVSLYYREKTKTRPAGYYWTYHYKTAKAGNSIETMTEDGQPLNVERVNNLYADSLGALERIADIVSRAHLSDRESLIVKYFCTIGASNAGARARARAFDRYTRAGYMLGRDNLQAIDNANYTARIKYALRLAGVTEDATQRQALHRLTDKLRKATANRPTQDLPTLTPYDMQYWAHMLQTNHGNAVSGDPLRPDGIAWTDRPATPYAPIITWTTPTDRQTIDPATLAKADTLRAYCHNVRRDLDHHKAPAGLDLINAGQSAQVFLSAMTPDELQSLADIWQADEPTRKAQEQRAKALRRFNSPSAIGGAWYKWYKALSPEERTAYHNTIYGID